MVQHKLILIALSLSSLACLAGDEQKTAARAKKDDNLRSWVASRNATLNQTELDTEVVRLREAGDKFWPQERLDRLKTLLSTRSTAQRAGFGLAVIMKGYNDAKSADVFSEQEQTKSVLRDLLAAGVIAKMQSDPNLTEADIDTIRSAIFCYWKDEHKWKVSPILDKYPWINGEKFAVVWDKNN